MRAVCTVKHHLRYKTMASAKQLETMALYLCQQQPLVNMVILYIYIFFCKRKQKQFSCLFLTIIFKNIVYLKEMHQLQLQIGLVNTVHFFKKIVF